MSCHGGGAEGCRAATDWLDVGRYRPLTRLESGHYVAPQAVQTPVCPWLDCSREWEGHS